MVLRSFDACCELYNFVWIHFFSRNVHTVVIHCETLLLILKCVHCYVNMGDSSNIKFIRLLFLQPLAKIHMKKRSRNSISMIERNNFFIDDEMKNGKLMKWLMELFSNMKIELMPCFFEREREKNIYRVTSWDWLVFFLQYKYSGPYCARHTHIVVAAKSRHKILY